MSKSLTPCCENKRDRVMKKWWFEYRINDNFEFHGWINTVHEDRDSIPDKISGWVTCWPDPNGKGMHGYFVLDPSLTPRQVMSDSVMNQCYAQNQFAFGNCYLVFSDKEDKRMQELRKTNPRLFAEEAAKLSRPVRSYPRFVARLEETWVPEHTYVVELGDEKPVSGNKAADRTMQSSDVTDEYKDMIESFECDFALALEGKHSLSELDLETMRKDINLLKKLSFELRYGKAKIIRTQPDKQ